MAYDDDFTKGETVSVGPIGEGTKRRNDARNERLAQNNKTPNGVAPAPKGTVTTKKTKTVGTIEGLNIHGARREDPEYIEIRNREAHNRLKRNRVLNANIKTEDNPDGNLIIAGRTTTGSIRLKNAETGEEYDYPESGRDIPGYSSRARNRDKRVIEGKTDLRYKSGIINGTIEPVDAAKSSRYKVTRKEVEVEQEVKPMNFRNAAENNTEKKVVGVDETGAEIVQDVDADFDDNIDGVHEAEVNNASDGTSTVDGSGGGHVLGGGATDQELEAFGGQGEYVAASELDVKSDPTKAPILVFNDIDEAGEPLKGTGGIKYLTKEEAQELYDDGRIKRSLLDTHSKQIDIRAKADAKGNIPYDEDKYVLNQDGDLVERKFLTQDNDGVYRDSRDGSAFTGMDTDNVPSAGENVTESVRGPRVATGIAGIPSEHKVKLYTRNPTWLTGTLQSLLKTGNGIIFPYTPTININHSANYGTYDINQSVEQTHFYSMTPNASFQLTAVFTANTAKEAEYMLACIHFLRTATKSDFGAYKDGIRRTDAGTPPPVLVFSGYGTEMFNNIPVVVRSVNFTLPEDVDYVTVQTQNAGEIVAGRTFDRGNLDALGNDISGELQTQENAGTEYIEDHEEIPGITVPDESSSVPTSILFSIDLAPQHPPSQLRDEWNFEKYASGDLLRKGYI